MAALAACRRAGLYASGEGGRGGGAGDALSRGRASLMDRVTDVLGLAESRGIFLLRLLIGI